MMISSLFNNHTFFNRDVVYFELNNFSKSSVRCRFVVCGEGLKSIDGVCVEGLKSIDGVRGESYRAQRRMDHTGNHFAVV